MNSAFPFVDLRIGAAHMMPLGYDPDGRLVRCSKTRICVHQQVLDGELGWAGRFSAGWVDESALAINGYMTPVSGETLSVRKAPTAASDLLYELETPAGANVVFFGPTVEADGRSWFRALTFDEPHVPAGYVDASSVALSNTPRDAVGELPRMTRRPTDLADLVGAMHSDPLDDDFSSPDPGSVQSLLGVGYSGAGTSVSTTSPGNGRHVEYPVNNALAHLLAQSEVSGPDEWAITEIWRIEAAVGQYITDGGPGRCPFLEGGDDSNFAHIVVDSLHQPVAGWIWLDGDYVEVDVSDVVCSG